VQREHPSPVIRPDIRPRYAAVILVVALLASLAVAVFRIHTESQTRRVEIAMDYTDFVALARSYNYNPSAFLIALRRAGLTSLAVTEELGSNVGLDGRANAMTGAALMNQAQLSPLSDPVLESLVRTRRIVRDAVYLIVTDPATYERYRRQLALHYEPKTVRVLRPTKPWIIEVRTQIDYFNANALGIPADQIALAKHLGLLLIPRFQNDERFQRPQMEAAVNDVLRQYRKVSTVMFFGLRNQVFGFPDHLDDAAMVFRAHNARAAKTTGVPEFNFGNIETYDDSQIQKGSETLARNIEGQTVRVQAIARTELDKITLDDVIGRYVLGVRERNIRVVYLRPWLHQDGDLTIEQTNVEMVKDIADTLKAHGFKLGRATPIPQYHGNNRILVFIAALAMPSIVLLLLGLYGLYRHWHAWALYGFTVLLYLAGLLSHHDIYSRSIIALIAALAFAMAAFIAVAGACNEEPAKKFTDQLVRSIGWTLVVLAVTLCGALVIVGIMSSPLTMVEVERFHGVRLILALPPLIALVLFLWDKRFNAGVEKPTDVLNAPVRVYQLFTGIVIVAAGVLLLMRSGNESDIAPSHFELVLRHFLTGVLSVRPRFKEFLIGIPALMLMPAVLSTHRRIIGWLLALAIGVGIGDVLDTFSHLHTPILISLQRTFNGLWVGAIIAAIAIWIYRRACIAFGLLRVR
jgi:hypothetical protein